MILYGQVSQVTKFRPNASLMLRKQHSIINMVLPVTFRSTLYPRALPWQTAAAALLRGLTAIPFTDPPKLLTVQVIRQENKELKEQIHVYVQLNLKGNQHTINQLYSNIK